MKAVRPYVSWGDRRHWELHAGRFILIRWCAGAPCHLVPGRHPLRFVVLRRPPRIDTARSRQGRKR